MKRFFILISAVLSCLILFSVQASAQLHETIKAGSKVFVTSDHPEMINRAKKYIREGCWTVVNDPTNADFVIKIKAKRIIFVGMFAHAEFIDPKTREIIYKSGTSNTVMRLTFNNKTAVLKKLIRRRLNRICDDYKPAYIELSAPSGF